MAKNQIDQNQIRAKSKKKTLYLNDIEIFDFHEKEYLRKTVSTKWPLLNSIQIYTPNHELDPKDEVPPLKMSLGCGPCESRSTE